MNENTSQMNHHSIITRAYGTFGRIVFWGYTSSDAKERRRLRLLSLFLLLMTLITLSGSFPLKALDANIANIMLATSGLMLISYFISRTRFYPVAIRLALILPTITPAAMVIFKSGDINYPDQLMWLALPLLIASFMLSIRRVIIAAACYIIFIIILATVGSIRLEIYIPVILFMLAISFFVITIAFVRGRDQSEIEHQLKERQAVEKALRESEAKFNKAFHASPDAICIGRTKDLHIIEVNESMLRLTGLTREEMIDRRADEIGFELTPEDMKRIVFLMMQQKKFYNEEFTYINKSGSKRRSLVSIELIDINGEKCVLVVITDITERIQAEDNLKLAMANLEHSTAQLQATNKELESFSYSVSHDLRAPLRSIDGFSQALLEDYADKLDTTGKDYLNRMRNASQTMGSLIDGMLRLSRLTRSEMHREKVDLGAVAQEIYDQYQETHPRRNIKFTVGDDLLANGDPQMVHVLLENLLGNAFKFTSKTRHPEIELGKTTTNGAQKTFFVKDNGAGFDMVFKDKLFGAFQRLHDTTDFPGTGIGLATVQRIINRHGGSISAEGKVGKGATFYFNFNGEA